MISAARLPIRFLPVLAGFRADAAVTVYVEGDLCWVRWIGERDDLVTALRPVPDVGFYEFRTPDWYKVGHRLPSVVRPPAGTGESLARLLFPSSFPITPVEMEAVAKLPLRLVRGGPAFEATALSTTLDALKTWGDSATTAELRQVRTAAAGSRVYLVGTKLPVIAGAERFWGKELFLPVGFRLEPEMPERIVREAIGATDIESAFFFESGIDLVPRTAFEPLTRAGLRLAVPA